MQDLRMAKAEDWYAVQSFAASISLISERYIDPFYRCNIWHVRGRDRDLLIDSGMGVVSLMDLLGAECRAFSSTAMQSGTNLVTVRAPVVGFALRVGQ